LYVFSCAACLLIENVVVIAQTSSRPQLTTPQIAEQVTPAVVSIVGANGFGSGVVVDGAGVIVTNLHVVQGETALSIELNNGDVYDDVGVVDVDERRDIALLKIKAFNLPAAILGDSDDVRVGESVVLVGSPEGLDFTVSEGVISALRDSGDGYQMIQTSAPASPGSSGGGMFNEFGELIAIVTSQFTDGQNLNFALPINYVRGRLSTETTMSLEELAIRTGDARVTPDGDGGPEAEELNPEDIQRLREVMADVGYPSAESEDVLGRWILSIPDGEYLDPIPVTVELFLNGLVLIRGWTADPVTELSSGQLMKMLELNWDYNYAKVSFDSDGSVWAHAEIPLRILDAAAVDSLVFGVALATDLLTGIIEGRDDEITSTTQTSADISVEEINRYLSTFNENLPMMVDSETQLLNGIASGGRITWRYKMVNFLGSELPDDFIALTRDTTMPQVCTLPDSRELIDRGVPFVYSYSDKINEYIGHFEVTQADCGQY